jgi:MSHA biogenesis protein MshJ
MKARWQALSQQFTALQQREKLSVVAAVILVIVMGGNSFWIEPAQRRLATLEKQIAKDKLDMQTLQAQITGLQMQLKDPDEANRKALAQARAEMADSEQALREYDQVLVPPERAPKLLQMLFAHHRGLELVSLQTLAPAPLLAAQPAKSDAKADAKAPTAAVTKGENIQKHGIEIKMAGSYPDLLAYVAELEQLPQKLLWDSMALTVLSYPKSELTLTVSTLSLNSIWLVF